MDNLNEHSMSPAMSTGNFSQGLPFYGSNGDFNFTVSRSKFTPGISIKLVPLTDLSVRGDAGFSELDLHLNKLKLFFKPGDRVRGLLVNSQLENEDGKIVVGKLQRIQVDYSNNTIHVFIKNPKTLEVQEVYPETIERLYESHRALTFTQFINS